MHAAAGHTVEAIPQGRRLVRDALAVGTGRHMVHAFVEVDVTRARRILHEHKQATGAPLSFTAFVIAAAARAVAEHKHLNAYRNWRDRLVVFNDVDVATLVEAEIDGVAIPHVIRDANHRSVREIHDEIRAVQANPTRSTQRSGYLARVSRYVPGLLRRLLLRVLRRCPTLLRRLAGTIAVTAVGMFGGTGAGWAQAIVPLHTLGLTLGAIAERPGLAAGQLVTRELLAVTISVDHDIVDGAPAARFVRRLRELIETAEGLGSV